MGHSSKFRQIMQQTDIDLLAATLEIARNVAYPTLDRPAVKQQLAVIYEAAAIKTATQANHTASAVALSNVLFREMGFRGNHHDYADPRNSYINELLATKQGLPIMLSVLFILVARELNLTTFGVGLPGHFIVRVEADGEPLFIDPFHEGNLVTINDCVRLVHSSTGHFGQFRTEWLAAVDDKEIVARILRNLRASYLQKKNWVLARRVIEHLIIVEPHIGQHERDRGLVLFQGGDQIRGLFYLEQYLEANPEAPDAEELRKGLHAHVSAWERLN